MLRLLHSSLYTMLPGLTYCCIMGRSAKHLSTKKHSPVVLSIPPNTQLPSTTLPRLNFHFPNLLFIYFNLGSTPWSPTYDSTAFDEVLVTCAQNKIIPVHSSMPSNLHVAIWHQMSCTKATTYIHFCHHFTCRNLCMWTRGKS